MARTSVTVTESSGNGFFAGPLSVAARGAVKGRDNGAASPPWMSAAKTLTLMEPFDSLVTASM